MARPKRADAKNSYAETDVDMASDSDSPAPVIKPKAGAPSKKARVEESASDADSRAEEDAFEPTTTTKKKATKSKSAKSKPSTKVGKLQAFQAVPFDVFAEICQHLNSKDLINLSLSSKNIRANLVGQAAVPLWRNARRSVGLPDLEAGVMTEVQYAYLFVVMKCQGCRRSAQVPQCDVFLLTRLCKDCRKNMWTSNLRSGGLHPLTHVCVPTTLPYATKTDVEFISKKLHDLESQDKEIAKALASKSKSKSKSKAPEASPPTPLLDAYVEARKLLLVKMKADGETLSKAAGNLQLNQYLDRRVKASEDQQAGRIRRRAIEEKATALGWSRQDFTGPWYTSAIINKNEPLTDAVWEKIKKSVIKMLESQKAERIQRDHDLVVQGRQNLLRNAFRELQGDHPSTDYASTFPLFADFLHLPHVKTHWEDEGDKFDAERWKAELDLIKNDVAELLEWRRVHAIKTVLAGNSGGKIVYDDLSDDAADYDAKVYDKAWFERLSSLLVCNIPNCRRKSCFTEWGQYITFVPQFFGSLQSLLEHQQKSHPTTRKFTDDDDELAHFVLPTCIADTMKAFISASEIDVEKEGGLAELDRIGHFQWTNSSKPNKDWPWRTLLDEVYRKTALTSKPRPFTAPEVKVFKLGGMLYGDWLKQFREKNGTTADTSGSGLAPFGGGGGRMDFSEEEEYFFGSDSELGYYNF
ncbi:hypothetical protein RQP46_008298 [Phenoliferia psychrophenolica]